MRLIRAAALLQIGLWALPLSAHAGIYAQIGPEGQLQVQAEPIAGVPAFNPRVPYVPAPVVPRAAPPSARVVRTFDPLIIDAGRRAGVDAALLHAVVQVESAYNPRALSRAGAAGLMQLMPATARRFGVRDRFDAAQNLHGGAAYLAWLIEHFDGDLELVLAAYNAGEGAVRRHGNRIPPYNETRQYVRKVLARYPR